MVTVREVKSDELIKKAKEELKGFAEITPPEWMKFAKSGVHRERPPLDKDFWYTRVASVLRRIYLNGPVGTSKLRSYYGGRRRRGHKPAHFRKASGNIIRKMLQQLEKAGLVDKDRKGRKVTAKGRKLMDKIAYEVAKHG
jgi:small subunit ribosomal protein S19e